MKKPISVLVVDDSSFIREAITTLLSMDDGINVSGEAANGQEALDKVLELKPDLVTMDIVMPVMDGLEAIERIMHSNAVPILVLTSKDDAHTAFTAISKGALEVLPKPELDLKNAGEFISKVKLLSNVKVISHISGRLSRGSVAKELPRQNINKHRNQRIVAVAASTGGPNALSDLFSKLPGDFPYPIVVAQHIHEEFIPGMVEWLDEVSTLTVKESAQGDRIQPGFIYISPAEKHMEIDLETRVSLVDRGRTDIYFPSCNRLLSSVARAYGKSVIGIVLSGMGDDGVLGIEEIKKKGGMTIAQDEKSSIVFGMPKEAIKTGCIDKVLPLGKISSEIVKLI